MITGGLHTTMASLLAIDLGIRTGLALYGQDGKLRWYRSQNFGTTTRLRRGVHTLLHEIPDVTWLIMEGGGTLATIWEREATRYNIAVRQISAETWRTTLLHPREQRRGHEAKHHADTLARRVIEWSGARRPTSLRHDAAEAILIGLWGVLELAWLEHVPDDLDRHTR